MTEGLREVADQAAGRGVVLLGEQADVVAEGQQPLEQFHGLLVAAHERVVVGEPEAAGEEGAFAGRQPVLPLPSSWV